MCFAPDEVVGDFVLFVVMQCFMIVLIGQFLLHLVLHDTFGFLVFLILAVDCESIGFRFQPDESSNDFTVDFIFVHS